MKTLTTRTQTPSQTQAEPTNQLILAIDLGKYKSVACLHEPASGEVQFTTFVTSIENLTRLLERRRPSVVVIEACLLAGWVHDLCAGLGVRCVVANTASEAWKFKHSKRKTDKDDALRLATLYALGQLPTVCVPPPATRQWRSLIAGRQKLVGLRVRTQNRIRALLVGQGLPAPRGAKAWTQTGLEGIGAQARPLAECAPEELWRGQLQQALEQLTQACQWLAQYEAKLDALARKQRPVVLLESTPGVGPRTAEAVAAYLHAPGRFTTGKQVGAYVGLVPRQYQSGETDRRGRITRRGPALLRKLLVECAWCCLRYNAWARAVYQRLTQGGKRRRKVAIVALARKLLVRLWAMLRDGTRWRGEPAAATAAPA